MTEQDDRLKGYVGAMIMFLVVIGITVSLFFFEIPEKNNDVIKLIIGVLVGSLSPIVYSILGKDPAEIEKKNNKIAQLEAENLALEKRVLKLEEMMGKLQSRIIDRISDLKEDDE